MNTNIAEWEGRTPPKKSSCPFAVEFHALPVPSNKFDSMEAGMVQLTARMIGTSTTTSVVSVSAKMTNNQKKQMKNSSLSSGGSELKDITRLSIDLQQNNSNDWYGEFSIPITWLEGGTKTFEKTGSYNPASPNNAFTMKITYILSDGLSCTAQFNSTDAFHWTSTEPKA